MYRAEAQDSRQVVVSLARDLLLWCLIADCSVDISQKKSLSFWSSIFSKPSFSTIIFLQISTFFDIYYKFFLNVLHLMISEICMITPRIRITCAKMYVHLVKNTAYSKTIIRKKFIENSPKQFRWYLGRVTTSLNHQVRLRHFFASYQTSHRHHQMSWWVL